MAKNALRPLICPSIFSVLVARCWNEVRCILLSLWDHLHSFRAIIWWFPTDLDSIFSEKSWKNDIFNPNFDKKLWYPYLRRSRGQSETITDSHDNVWVFPQIQANAAHFESASYDLYKKYWRAILGSGSICCHFSQTWPELTKFHTNYQKCYQNPELPFNNFCIAYRSYDAN